MIKTGSDKAKVLSNLHLSSLPRSSAWSLKILWILSSQQKILYRLCSLSWKISDEKNLQKGR
jgi:hypothetical protein